LGDDQHFLGKTKRITLVKKGAPGGKKKRREATGCYEKKNGSRGTKITKKTAKFWWC